MGAGGAGGACLGKARASLWPEEGGEENETRRCRVYSFFLEFLSISQIQRLFAHTQLTIFFNKRRRTVAPRSVHSGRAFGVGRRARDFLSTVIAEWQCVATDDTRRRAAWLRSTGDFQASARSGECPHQGAWLQHLGQEARMFSARRTPIDRRILSKRRTRGGTFSVFCRIHVRHASGRGYAPLPSATLLVNSPTGRSFDPSPSVHSPTWKNFNLRGHVLKRKIFLDVASPGQISLFTASRTRDRTGSPSFASPKRPCPIFHVRLFPSTPAAPLPHAHLGRTHALAPQHHRVK